MNSVSDAADLEAEKRREYEEWFKLQEKEALEYSACVKYQEKIGETESEDVTESQQQSNECDICKEFHGHFTGIH